jgi:hypothetical protein
LRRWSGKTKVESTTMLSDSNANVLIEAGTARTEASVNRNRLITASVVVAVFIILLIYGLLWWQSRRSGIGQRSPISDLGYCSSNDIRPCIASFSLDSDGNMLVNVLTPGLSFPAFYLKIIHNKGENIYECKKVERFSTSVYCIGEAMRLGEVLQFMLISVDGEATLAEGQFAIIGLALSTPELALLSPTIDLTASATPGGSKTPTPIRTPATPSYPNPPYP